MGTRLWSSGRAVCVLTARSLAQGTVFPWLWHLSQRNSIQCKGSDSPLSLSLSQGHKHIFRALLGKEVGKVLGRGRLLKFYFNFSLSICWITWTMFFTKCEKFSAIISLISFMDFDDLNIIWGSILILLIRWTLLDFLPVCWLLLPFVSRCIQSELYVAHSAWPWTLGLPITVSVQRS